MAHDKAVAEATYKHYIAYDVNCTRRDQKKTFPKARKQEQKCPFTNECKTCTALRLGMGTFFFGFKYLVSKLGS